MSDRPIIKAPVWTWEIPIYFYVGGLAGASAGVARLAEARGNDALADRAAAVAAAGAAVSPALLISDLGRPARFLHMLRMFKVTSPMSIGSWTLAAFGTAAGAGLLDRLAGGRVPGAGLIAAAARRSRAAAVAGGALVTAGAVLARWSVYKAGFRSAADPSDTVAPQRARLRARSA